MRNFSKSKLCMLAVYAGFASNVLHASAEDIDIYTGTSGGTALNANVLIILDNTSNWSAANQQWPEDGGKQGISELKAIKTVVSEINSNVNLGLMMLTPNGSGNPGGYIRSAIVPLTDTNKATLQSTLDTIINNFQSSSEKAASNANYGNALFDAFKYFGGFTNPANATKNIAGSPISKTHYGTPVFNDLTPALPQPDRRAYTDSTLVKYAPPETLTNYCARNYIIFIGNGFPNPDEKKWLANVGGDTKELALITEDAKTYVPTKTARTADEWTKFLLSTDVNSATGQQSVSTFTIDVYKAQQDLDQTALLRSMAKVGGGKYYAATSRQAIVAAIKEILAEIQAVNTTFASTSLPVNATNRTQNENQVFIGMFRPDANAKPRWFGNLKRYQLINTTGTVELGDVDGNVAVNPLTGFVTNCAKSYWTTDSGNYWQNVTMTPSPASACTTSTFNAFSDAPDGPQVEKGGSAEVIRKGNNPPNTNTTPTWAVNRTIYTESAGALTEFNANSSSLSSDLVNFVRGNDTQDENQNAVLNETRPSLHGDVIHSRPLPVNYGGTSGVTVYYGSNDGMLRAVDAANGKERWAFIAREFFPRLARLKDNSPLVNYPTLEDGIVPTPKPKDYFFDGTTGIYQNADSSKVYIYPTTRRGGRMVYAFDVSNPDSPSFKWKIGCPNLTDDTGCTTGMSDIGQTWSAPNIAFIKGFSTTTPVLMIGGGYDNCEDEDSVTPSCSNSKGRKIFAINAETGALIASFNTLRSVVGDVAYVDIDSDGYPDYAYAADTGGNIYRISFINSPTTKSALTTDRWTIERVAYTNGAGRKFLFAPAVLPNSGKVYVALGSGDREHPLKTHYPYEEPVLNRFYVYVDDLAATTALNTLIATNMDDPLKLHNFTSGTTCSTPPVLPSSSMKGWFMDLNKNGRGEQVVTSALIASSMVTFSTNRPITDSNQCSTILGEARGYWVNLLNGSGSIGVNGNCGGSRSTTFVGGGLPPSPVLATGVPINGRPTTVVIGAARRDSGASTTISPQQVKPTIVAKRKKVYSLTSTDN